MSDKKELITPFSDEELEHFENIIRKKRAEAKKEHDQLKEQLEEQREKGAQASVYTHHMGDAGTDVEEEETIYTLMERERKFIKKLDEALERIENKTYGICKVTGKPIPKERLEAVPHTQLSIEAKKDQKR